MADFDPSKHILFIDPTHTNTLLYKEHGSSSLFWSTGNSSNNIESFSVQGKYVIITTTTQPRPRKYNFRGRDEGFV